jgi:mono/diheme cytochrome c family protein
MTLLPNPSGSTRRKLPVMTAAFLALILLAGCAQTGQMVYMPRYDTYESAPELFGDWSSARPLPEGVVPYTGDDGPSPNDPALTGLNDVGGPVSALPVEVTHDLVARGQERYDIFCAVCHGATGEGNGNAVTIGRFPAPPNLLDSQLSDGEMFDVIKNGRGLMFPYGYRVKAPDRWAVIAYIRAMQLKDGAVVPQDLTDEEINQLGGQ